jgi:hypothetical protein
MMVAGLLLALCTSATVQERVFSKADTVAVQAGGTWLERGDLLSSPGISFALTHYWDESLAFDYVQGSYFFTRERDTARQLEKIGFNQTREWPKASIGSGVRYAFGYAKLLLEATGGVVHFAPEVAAHAGLLFTKQGARPMADVGLGVRARLADALVLLVEYRVGGSSEPEGLVFAQQPMVMVGVGW